MPRLRSVLEPWAANATAHSELKVPRSWVESAPCLPGGEECRERKRELLLKMSLETRIQKPDEHIVSVKTAEEGLPKILFHKNEKT